MNAISCSMNNKVDRTSVLKIDEDVARIELLLNFAD